MAQTPLPSPLKPEELAAIFGTGDELDVNLPQGTPTPRPPRRRRRPLSLAERVRGLPKWVLFLTGLAIGWLVIGWLVWPIQWTNSDPWDMTVKNQKAFVQLVADRYWTDRDLAQAEATLGSWDRDAVNTLLVTLQAETIDVDARQRLAALTQALQLPGGEQSMLASILNQEGVLIALAIATLPMFIAVGLVISSRVKTKPGGTTEDGEAAADDDDEEAELEELLADVQLEAGQMGMVIGPDGLPEQPGAPGDVPPDQQQQQEEATNEEEESEESGHDPNNPLGDLASLFAEEDTSVAQLELLSKGMPEIDIDELLAKARELVRRFREERPKQN